MATIISYTTIKQSRKLAEILPLSSADMYYSHEFVNSAGDYHKLNVSLNEYFEDGEDPGSDIPCWSLAALLGVLPKGTRLLKSATDDIYYHCDCPKGNIDKWFDNPVDACVDMIIKLNELNLL